MRLSNSFFVSATFFALVVQTANDNLRPVEVYLILLLTFGAYYSFVPLYICRIIIRRSPRWDLSRYPRVPTGRIFSRSNFTLLVSVSIFQLWFWIKRVKAVGNDGCQEYGFLFAKVRLNEKVFEAANILFNILLLIFCVAILIISVAIATGAFKEKKHRKIRNVRKVALQEIQTFVNLVTASMVVSATEITIQWNGITGVNDVSSAGQLIPMVIGIGLVIRVLYIWLHKGDSEWNSKKGTPKEGGKSPSGTGSGSGSNGGEDPVAIDDLPGLDNVPDLNELDQHPPIRIDAFIPLASPMASRPPPRHA